jgi:hypothetical protein
MSSANETPEDALSGKRILFIAPRFFSYENDIIAALERRGAKVDWLPDRPFDTPFMTAVTRFQPRAILPAAYRLYRKKLTEFGRASYDIVLVLNGQTLPKKLLIELRAELPKAQFILYMWDSLENRGSIVENLDQFDDCLSFDPRAVERFGMHLRPLFFSPGFEMAPEHAFDHDISFIGTAHTDRYHIVSEVDANLPADKSRFWYLFLQARWVYHVYRRTNPAYKGASISDFRFDPLPRSTVQGVFRKSSTILDIEHPMQTGLTMRTFETMGAQKKLVTTNEGVRDYPFYDAQNIHVIDRKKPSVPAGFLETPYRSIEPSLYQKYSIDGWVEDVLKIAPKPS